MSKQKHEKSEITIVDLISQLNKIAELLSCDNPLGLGQFINSKFRPLLPLLFDLNLQRKWNLEAIFETTNAKTIWQKKENDFINELDVIIILIFNI